MTWKKITGYELEWQVRGETGRVTMLFGEGKPVPRSVSAHDFSIIADMLRHELSKLWYEDAQEILKTSDIKPEDLSPSGSFSLPQVPKRPLGAKDKDLRKLLK